MTKPLSVNETIHSSMPLRYIVRDLLSFGYSLYQIEGMLQRELGIEPEEVTRTYAIYHWREYRTNSPTLKRLA